MFTLSWVSDRCFVAGKDIKNNVLYIVRGGDSPYLLSSAFDGVEMRWTSDLGPPSCRPPGSPDACPSASGRRENELLQNEPTRCHAQERCHSVEKHLSNSASCSHGDSGAKPQERRVEIQTRYRQQAVPCVIYPDSATPLLHPAHPRRALLHPHHCAAAMSGATQDCHRSGSDDAPSHVGYVPQSLQRAVWDTSGRLPKVPSCDARTTPQTHPTQSALQADAMDVSITTHVELPAGLQGCPDRVRFVPTSPLRAVTPGQTVAVYDAEYPDLCLGGGMILSVVPVMP